MARFHIFSLFSALAVFAIGSQLSVQSDHRLMNRWVGTHDGHPWWLDFYGDTMLVVDDTLLLDFRITRDSLVAYGDTSFAVAYWFVRDRLLVQAADGEIITMALQDHMARPIHGDWRGDGIRMRIWRGGVVTRSGTRGEWRRRSRVILFTWLPDSLEWTAQYDPIGAALLTTVVEPDSSTRTVILRKGLRW